MNDSIEHRNERDSVGEQQSVNESKRSSGKPKQKRGLFHRLLLIFISLFIVGFLVFLNFYFKNLYYDLYLLTKDVIDKRNFQTFVSIFVINTFLQMCFVPGISLFIIYIGFITKSYFYSLALIYPSTILICAMTFLLTRYSIKDRLRSLLARKWFFRMYYDLSKTQPWKTSFMLRILLIPVTYKNYLISLMDINFIQFIVPACIYYPIYFSSYIMIGILISSVQDIINGKIPDSDKGFYYGLIAFYSILIALSIGVVIYLIVLTARAYKQYKRVKSQQDTSTDNLLNRAV